MALSGTYTRSTTTVTVTTATAHGMSTGQTVYMDFTSGGALDGSYVITVTTTTAFTLTTVASGTITTSNCLVYNAYSISGSYSLTIYKSNHGYIAGRYVSIDWKAGTYPGASYATYTWVVLASNLAQNSFEVDSPITATATGGIDVGPAARAVYTLDTGGDIALKPLYLRQVGSYTLRTAGEVTLTTKRIVQIASYTLGSSMVVRGLEEISRIQVAGYELLTKGALRLRASYPQFANYLLALQWRSAPPAMLPVQPPSTLAWNGAVRLNLVCQIQVTRGQDTYRDLLDNAATMFGRRTAAELPNDQRDLIVTFAAAAVQEMFSRAEQLDHFNRLTRDMTLAANTNTLTLANDVQSLQGFVRITATKRPLAPVQTEAEIERYATLFLTAADDTSVPHAYYAKRQSAETAYGMTTTLVFSPQPTEAVPLQVEVLLAAPRYTWANYEACTALSIARRYVASVLVPLVRMQCAGSRYFNNDKVLPEIKAQYAQARAMLGYTDTTPRAAKAASSPATSTALVSSSAPANTN
jgi:hypothetical protein